MNKLFAIQCVNDPELFWSNEYGWVEFDCGVDYFTEDETNYLNLPIEGKWVIDFVAEYDEMSGEYE